MSNNNHLHTKLGGPDCEICNQSFSPDFEEYLELITQNRLREIEQVLEQRSIKANAIHRGTKE
jgi:hypothetical protein